MTTTPSKRHFPPVRGENLNRQRFSLPGDFEGQLNLLFIAFQQWHQMEVNSWMPFARRLADHHPELRYYELPTIRRMNPLFQSWIDGGMRAGIPDQGVRAATITLYIDKEPFRRALGITDEDHIFVALVEPSGFVHAHTTGAYAAATATTLAAAVARLLETTPLPLT